VKFLDARRLTGPNLHFDEPAAVLDVECTTEEAAAFIPAWRAAVEGYWSALGEPGPAFSRIDLDGGISLAFTAPIDALYTASEVNEQAFIDVTGLPTAEPAERSLDTLREALAEEHNSALLALQKEAGARDVPFFWDDDEASLGMGRHSAVWPVRELPGIGDVDWASHRDIPVGLVTGTNGKTTTVRLARHILRGAGLHVGVSSTDWIAIDDTILDRGDWSGPGGARAVLRQPAADVGVLEAARGGLLRRGLGVESAAAAVITNIAADHLGDFGSRNLDELLAIKWVVTRAVSGSGRLILNAEDQRLVRQAAGFAGEVVWFSLDAALPLIRAHIGQGGIAYVLRDGDLVRLAGGAETSLCVAADIPITLGGAARHNVANALAAAALAFELGAGAAQVRAGLQSMSQDANPGRCNVYAIGERHVLVDFAHNPQAMRALFDMARALPARRRALCFGQAGDRPDALIREMTRDAWAIGLDRVYISELADYRRGREAGAVYAVIRDELLRLGAQPGAIEHHELESESFGAAMDWAGDGDLVIMLALGSYGTIREQIDTLIRATG